MIEKIKALLKKEEAIKTSSRSEVANKNKRSDKLNYTGVPAPNYLPHDDWFPNPFMKDKEIEFAGNYEGPLYAPYTAVDAFKKSIGDDGMHQKMYDMSTRSGKTTLQLNPIGGSENFQGGSENVHR